MSAALTTTSAGAGLPGKAASIRWEVTTSGVPLGCDCSKVRLAVCMVTSGAASASSRPAASTAAASGKRSTGVRTAFQIRLPLFRSFAFSLCRNGTRPLSTRSPSIDSRAGSTVSEPSTAVITTTMVA